MENKHTPSTDKIGEEFGGIDSKAAARNERLFNYLLILAVLVVGGAIVYQFLVFGPGSKYAERDRQARLQLRAQKQATELAETEATERKEYRAATTAADSLRAAGQYEAAAFQLRNAVSIFPDSLTTRIRLLEVYAENCARNERQCASAENLGAQLQSRPDVANDATLRRRVKAVLGEE